MTDYIPCPFCNQTKPIDLNYTNPNMLVQVLCNAEHGGCGASTGFYEDEMMAQMAWDARGGLTDGLLASMALRYRHDFGILPADEQRTIMAIMRQIHEEVVGKGFYKPEHEEKYLRALNYE